MNEPLAAEVEIVNQRGLHARAAARFVRTAEAFDAVITVVREDLEATGTSILGLMMLAAGQGTRLRLMATGPDAEAALASVADLVRRGFDET